ncbi:MAG: CmcJ/NvfI family oxidoreductase, partial [Polyangiales bacterium]
MDAVRARVTYSVDTGQRPVARSVAAGGRVELEGAELDEREIALHDAREVADELSLDRQGFVLVRGRSRVPAQQDDETLEREYYPQMAELVRQTTGASRVHVFDHTLRSGDESRGRREPVANVHNDYTEWSAPQ